MANRIQAIKGMHDALPGETQQWQFMENTIQSVLESYGYAEIRLPVLEKTDLFRRSIGEETDIVNKEMYTFSDRNDESITLRPEGTASCVRAVLEHNLLAVTPLRTWYRGPMFRYERPQKGRFRQFHQVGAEAFGIDSADIEAELILICRRMWQALGLDGLRLEINSLGNAASRKHYRTALVSYFSAHSDGLDGDSKRRLDLNPLRILDSKNPDMQELIEAAPALADSLDDESRKHFAGLEALLAATGVDYVVNPRLVRGLDYYNHTVFEWITDALGAQGTVCAGGRYDGLVEQVGGKATPAAGFAMGLERILALLQQNAATDGNSTADIYLVVVGSAAEMRGLQLAEQLRDRFPQLGILLHCGGGSFKSQLKKADRSGAAVALLLGDDEMADNSILIKPLRTGQDQFAVQQDNLAESLSAYY